ncbi:hypothetical protein RDI58_007361 [Solanum bulbocastanum]|uniref:Uncharacterized protein n=1 Tax=Solanum bulbocastanum TaxID=147425 RepID=A0AAN8TSP2_SOLBU
MEEIGLLFHLSFLKIRTEVKAIPHSWVNLQNLETLFIKIDHGIIMVLLPEILKLSKLKHVSIDMSSFFKKDVYYIIEAENSKLEDLIF